MMDHFSMPAARGLATRGLATRDAALELLDLLKDPFSGQLAATSVYSAIGISLGFTFFIAVAFSFIRPYNQSVYAPRLKHADKKHAPPPIGKRPWDWLLPLMHTREKALIHQIGMDATIFLRVMRMCRNMFLVLAVIGITILVPLTSIMSVKFDSDGNDADKNAWILQVTPLNVFGRPIWGQVAVAWLFDIVICLFLYWNYRRVMQLRRKYFESEEYLNSLHSRTLMLFDIPKQGCSDEGIARIIDKVVPNSSFARTAIARNVKDLPFLIEEHDHAVRKLEQILAKYLRNPHQLPAARPTCSPTKRDRAFATYPAGQKLDAIEYYTQRIRSLEVQIREVRKSVDKRSTMSFGFASYSDISETHEIAYACRKKKPMGTTIVLAPRPADIIWKNMPLSSSTRSRRRWVNSFWILLLTFLWIVPNAMIAVFLVNLGNLGKVWPAFQRSLQTSTTFWGIVQGIAPPALMSGVYLALPIIFRRLSIKAGDKTKTGRERHVLGKLYAFFVFNNLVVFSFFSVIWAFISGVVANTSHGTDAWDAIVKQHVAQAIFQAFCHNSPFWVTYLLQRQLGAAIDLAQIWPLVQAFFLKKFSSPTPRELIELTAPPPFDYASYYCYFLYYSTVTLCFAGIQPVVLLATAIYFCIDSYLKKYLILYRFVTKTESGGLFWRVVFNRFIFATILSNCVVMLTCWVQGEKEPRIQFYAVLPLPVLMLIFKVFCNKTFDDKIRYQSTRRTGNHAEAAMQKQARLRSEKLASRFGHPALYKALITPMVHQKAQNMLPSVYSGRLTDGKDADYNGPGDFASVSGYSDMYALDSMQGGGRQPGKTANNVPGFEYVSDAQMDFEYYKNRAEFSEEHGGFDMYGRGGADGRPGTPGSVDNLSDLSRPGTPVTAQSPTTMGMGKRPMMTTDTSYHSYKTGPYAAEEQQQQQQQINRTRSPLYASEFNNSSSGLVLNAANPAMAPPMPTHRDASLDRDRMGPGADNIRRPSPSPGPTRGAHSNSNNNGSMGSYTGLPQNEEWEYQEMDPTQYNYFRGSARTPRNPGQGW